MKKKLLENIYKETSYCWTLFFKSSTPQVLQKLVHQSFLLFQLLHPHCPSQDSHCQHRMPTSNCTDQICATRETGETFTEIHWVSLTQRCRAEITDQIIRSHIIECAQMIHRCSQKSGTASNSASGSPQKRAKISKHTHYDLTLMPTARVDEPLWYLPVTSVLAILLLDSYSLLRSWPSFYKNLYLLLRLSLLTKYPNAKIPFWSTTLCCAAIQNLEVVLWGPALSITECPTKEKRRKYCAAW